VSASLMLFRGDRVTAAATVTSWSAPGKKPMSDARAAALVSPAREVRPGNLGGFLAPIQRDYFKETLGGNAGLYSLSIGAVLAAVLFAVTAFFKKANEVEAGHLDDVDAMYVPHDKAEAARGVHRTPR
jgi:hypothetical protein